MSDNENSQEPEPNTSEGQQEPEPKEEKKEQTKAKEQAKADGEERKKMEAQKKADAKAAKEAVEKEKKEREAILNHRFESYKTKTGSTTKAQLLVDRDVAKEMLAEQNKILADHSTGAKPLNEKELKRCKNLIEECQNKLTEISKQYRKV